jgi:transposase
MAHGYRRFDRQQGLLLPPDLREWVPADHEVWAVIEAVDAFDLSAFMPPKRADGKGRAGYHPAMMVGLLLYAYAIGTRSSRAIQRLCEDNVAVRVLTGDQQPDHTTIARFRADHGEALRQLHVQVLALCAGAGMVRLGVVALDSTKMAANASGRANRRYEDIAELVARMHAEAAAADEAEDAAWGSQRADVLPEPLRDRTARRERFAAAKSRLEQETAAEHEQWRQRMERRQQWAQQGRKMPGKPIKQAAVEPTVEGRKANTTDPDSRMMKAPGGFVQGYSGQAIASEDGIVVATDVTNEQNDNRQLHPMLDRAQRDIAAAGIKPAIGVLLADRGYYSDDNVTSVEPGDPQLLIATMRAHKLKKRTAVEQALSRPHRTNTSEEMTRRVTSPDGAALYRKRQHIIEPVFGDTKHNRGITRFQRRGLQACRAEWSLIHTSGNLIRWARRRP